MSSRTNHQVKVMILSDDFIIRSQDWPIAPGDSLTVTIDGSLEAGGAGLYRIAEIAKREAWFVGTALYALGLVAGK